MSQATRNNKGTEVYEDARFEPIFLTGIGGAVVVDPDTNTSGSSLTIGITDGTTEYTMMLHDEDSTSTTNTHSRTTSTQFMSAYTDTWSIEWESTLLSFDVNGWTLDYTDGTTGDYLNAYLAIGLEPAPVTITGRAFIDEGVTPVATGTKISVAVNGGT
ncbi:MAG: hypothetical protein K8I00_12705, partial [Candidatus Omnitrophica bacterium]|nr:hypothetical protein [Candidatus Omnitrophota bacterium]